MKKIAVSFGRKPVNGGNPPRDINISAIINGIM
jgi:hypothetical protein